jgi:hypothetical protein
MRTLRESGGPRAAAVDRSARQLDSPDSPLLLPRGMPVGRKSAATGLTGIRW